MFSWLRNTSWNFKNPSKKFYHNYLPTSHFSDYCFVSLGYLFYSFTSSFYPFLLIDLDIRMFLMLSILFCEFLFFNGLCSSIFFTFSTTLFPTCSTFSFEALLLTLFSPKEQTNSLSIRAKGNYFSSFFFGSNVTIDSKKEIASTKGLFYMPCI